MYVVQEQRFGGHGWLHNGGPVCFLCWVVSQANFCPLAKQR